MGGKGIIKMNELRTAFDLMGFSGVCTYIQSGNVLFETASADKTALENQLNAALSERFCFEIKTFVRSQQEMQFIVDHFPRLFENTEWKHNVIFLSRELDSEAILQRFPLKPEIEQQSYAPGVLFWSAKQSSIGKSQVIKLSARRGYQEMTVRNQNTTQKILERMKNG